MSLGRYRTCERASIAAPLTWLSFIWVNPKQVLVVLELFATPRSYNPVTDCCGSFFAFSFEDPTLASRIEHGRNAIGQFSRRRGEEATFARPS